MLKKQPEANNTPITIAEKVAQSNQCGRLEFDFTGFFYLLQRIYAKPCEALVQYLSHLDFSRS